MRREPFRRPPATLRAAVLALACAAPLAHAQQPAAPLPLAPPPQPAAATATPVLPAPRPPAAAAPAPPPPGTARAASQLRETSVTLAQIVARQDENFARMRSARGGVVWREDTLDTTAARWMTNTRAVAFAFETTRSVNVVMRHTDGQRFPTFTGRSAWRNVLAAAHVAGDSVYTAAMEPGAELPVLQNLPFNPAIHSDNPLVAFHPRILGDERVSLRDLLAAQATLPARPRVLEMDAADGPRLVVDISPDGPRDRIYYLINPLKGYLAEEIGRLVDGRHAFRTQILIGHTSDGIWIPARRERLVYNAAGQPVVREAWYYDWLESNPRMKPLELTLSFFQLPPDTVVRSVRPSARRPDANPPPPAATPDR